MSTSPEADTAAMSDRRTLQFRTMGAILDDVEYLASGDPPRCTGNWSEGQIVQHLGKNIRYSIDGFPQGKIALPIRILARLIRTNVLEKPMRAGLKIPARFDFLAPDEGISWEDAVDDLCRIITRLNAERMTARSPVFGTLTHEQWEQLHCRHAELHLSFLHPA